MRSASSPSAIKFLFHFLGIFGEKALIWLKHITKNYKVGIAVLSLVQTPFQTSGVFYLSSLSRKIFTHYNDLITGRGQGPIFLICLPVSLWGEAWCRVCISPRSLCRACSWCSTLIASTDAMPWVAVTESRHFQTLPCDIQLLHQHLATTCTGWPPHLGISRAALTWRKQGQVVCFSYLKVKCEWKVLTGRCWNESV